MNNRPDINNKIVFEFLAGFLIPVAIVGFGYWASLADPGSNALRESIMASALFIGVFMFGSYFYRKDITFNKTRYIQNGIRALYITLMILLFLSILYCFIVPDSCWFWNSK